MQTFMFEGYLYFSSNSQPTSLDEAGELTKGHPMWIYRSRRIGDNQWGEPEVVVTSKFAVGEPSIPDDGSRLYFEQIFTDEKGNFKADMMYAEKK